MNVSHRQLKAFLLVARLRNFSRAAEQLFIAQSGLSLMIRELEGQLGFRLFDRTTRQVTLTRFGTEFLPVAEQNVQGLESAVAKLGQSSREANQWLRIGAPPMTSAYLLPEVIESFQARHKNVRLKIVDTDIASIAALVRSGDIDIGLGMFIKPTPGVLRHPLFKFSLAAASRAPAFQIGRSPRGWEQLRGQALISLPPDNPLQQLIDKHLAQAGHLQPPDYVVNFIETQIGLAAAGRGVAILPTTALAACRSRALRLDLLAEPVVDLDFYEVRDRARTLPAFADDFSALLKKSASKSMVPLKGR